MIATLSGGGTYDFFFNLEEAITLGSSRLETDLLDAETRMPLGKRARLHFEEPEFGDAELTTEPEGAGFEEARVVTITARIKYLGPAIARSNSNARLGSIGDVYFHVE